MSRTEIGLIRAAVAALLLGLTAGGAEAQFTTLDDPLGTKGSRASGIDGSNIVGYYVDSLSVSHGYLYNGSTYTTIDDPLGKYNQARGSFGVEIVGEYQDVSNGLHGYIYNPRRDTNATPEPGSISMLIGIVISGAGLLARRRKGRTRQNCFVR